MFKIINFLFFAQKVSSIRNGGITSKIFRGIAELEHPQDLGAKGVQIFFFFIDYFHYLFI